MIRALLLGLALLLAAHGAEAACVQLGGYPFVASGCLNAADLDVALENSFGPAPPTNAQGSGANYGKFWLDSGHRDSVGNVLRMCVAAPCSPTYNAAQWITFGVVFPGGLAPPVGTYSYQVPASGDTLTAAAALGAYVLNPAGVLATLTVVCPPSAVDGQLFGMSSTRTITALTVSPAAGQVVSGGATLLGGDGGVAFRYRTADATWRREY